MKEPSPIKTASKRESSLEQEGRELLRLKRDDRTMRIVHRLSLQPGKLQPVALAVFYQLKDAEPDGSIEVNAAAVKTTPEMMNALKYEIDTERLLYGDESVPERQEFLETREATQEGIRQLKRRLFREHVHATVELMSEQEKTESVLYAEVSQVLQDVAREMGFQRPVVLEITRDPDLNAFVSSAEKEGEDFDTPSNHPLHVYVNAGLIRQLDKVFAASNSIFSKDHLAGILGHELQHLRQPKYDLDKPEEDAKKQQQFEYDADLTGMEAADRAGYNPMAFIKTLEVMMKESAQFKEVLNHYFTKTHPVTENRVKTLLEEYHRPDRILFSANNDYQLFSPEVFTEATELTRVALVERCTNAKTLDDWHHIIDSLEADPKTTPRDVEVVMNFYKVHADAHSVLAAANYEMRTGALGLRDALLHAANVKVKGEKMPFDVLAKNVNNVPKSRLNILESLMKAESGDVAEQEYDDGVISKEGVQALTDFVYAHSQLIPEPGGPFVAVEELFDYNNPHAQQLWSWPDWVRNEQKADLVKEQREWFLKHIALLMWGGSTCVCVLRW